MLKQPQHPAYTDWQPVKKNGKDVTAANASVTLGNVSAGDVFEIKASIPSGYSAKCRVEVVKDTKKLALVSEYTTGENNKIDSIFGFARSWNIIIRCLIRAQIN